MDNWRKRFSILAVLLFLIPFIAFASTFIQDKFAIKKDTPFALVETSPEDNSQNTNLLNQPTLVFSQKLGVQEKDINKYVSIVPQPQGQWHLEKNGQVIRFINNQKAKDRFPDILAYDTIYTITVDKSLPSILRKTLEKTETIQFRTQKNSRFGISVEKKLVVGFPEKPIDFNLNTNANGDQPNSLLLTVYSATKEQLLSYFVHKENKYPMYNFVKTDNNKQIVQYVDLSKPPLTIQKNQYSTTVSLPPLEPGIYYIDMFNPNGHEDFFIVVSNHIAVSFPQDNNLSIWTTDPTGEKLPGVTVEMYSLTDKSTSLGQSITNSNGLITVQKKQNLDLLLTSYNGSFGVTQIGSFWQSSSASSNLTAFSYTDRSIYRPTDVIHYKAVIRDKQNGTYVIPKGKLYLALETDFTSKKDYKEVTLDKNGTVTADITIPSFQKSTYTSLILATKDGKDYYTIDSLYIPVSSYRKPDFDITVTTKEKEYVSRDTGHATIFAKTVYGEPLTNTPFSWRIVINDFTEVKDRSLENINQSYYGYGTDIASGSAMLNNKGEATITFPTDLLQSKESAIATIEITPNIGATPSTATINKLIHRGTFALFFSDILGNEESGITGKILSLNHDNPRKNATAKELSVSLYKVYGYQQENFIEKKDIEPNETGNYDFSFEKVEKGEYKLIATAKDDRENQVTSTFSVSVGHQQTAQNFQPTITLTTEKQHYKPNETAQVNLKSEVPLRSILVIKTTAAGKFIQKDPFLLLSGNSATTMTIPVTIPDNQAESIGVFVYAINDNDVITSNAAIHIDTATKQLKTTVTFDKPTVKPGEKITATILTTDSANKPVSADVSLGIVDSAIFQINSGNGQDIFSSFYPNYQYSIYLSHYNSTTGIYNTDGPGGGGGCFLEGTAITMSDGTYKNIENVRVGDTILTRASDISDTLVSDTVTKTYKHIVSEYITINNILHVTPIHKIFLNNSWSQAKEARIGDTLVAQDGTFVHITSIVHHIGTFAVYNLTTQKEHTFFADGFYVHNDKGGGNRETFVDTAYWNPHIKTDVNGNASVTITVPDNLTTFSAYAVANTKDSQFGQGTGSFVVKKDVAIIPTLPNFYYQNDKPVISMILQNGTSTPLNTTITLRIKDLGIEKQTDVTVSSGDFEKVSFPVSLATQKDTLTIGFSVKDKKTNQVLDSILLQKSLLPRLDIVSTWTSFQGKKDITFAPPFPNLPFNSMDVSVIPHIAYNIAEIDNIYFDEDPSSSLGQNLSMVSYVIKQTENGNINPSIYLYAKARNEIRNAINKILASRVLQIEEKVSWLAPRYPDKYETNLTTTLWIIKGLEDASSSHLTDEIVNLANIISIAKRTVQAETMSLTREEKLAKEFILHTPTDGTYQDDPAFLGVRSLNGDKQALTKLKEKAIISSDDRFIFAPDDAEYTQEFAALALVEKGTADDKAKAIKGLAIGTSSYDYHALGLLAGIKHAILQHLPIDKLQYTVSLNKDIIFDTKDKSYFSPFSQNFNVDEKEKNITVSVLPQSKLPIYTTITKTMYDNIKPLTKTEMFFSFLSSTENPKILDGKLKRSSASAIKSGQPGIISLSLNKPFDDVINPLTDGTHNDYAQFFLTEAVLPNVMYINQVGEASPQYESNITPTNFSDMHVFFSGTPRQAEKTIILPYVVYGLSVGEHHQPKTSIVFPKLGLIVNEK